MTVVRLFLIVVALAAADARWGGLAYAQLQLTLTSQIETAPGTGRFHRLEQPATWQPSRTAVVICDMWDSHHSVNAVRRVAEIAPRIDALAKQLRQSGATVIHAPSDCMDTYADHPARLRAAAVEIHPDTPQTIARWCDRIPAEEAGTYPLDQSGSTEDDDLAEHQQWAATLAANGRDPAAPWKAQTPVIEIDAQRDYISDDGREVWNILRERGVESCLVVGVHTNMCVLGRPFGLRQLSQHGQTVALVRDLTDTMYDPNTWPYVNHFSGTDLIVDHIERYVCPTITSDQILGGQPHRFDADHRPHVAVLIAEDEYETAKTLTALVNEQLRRDFRITLIYGSEDAEDDSSRGIPGLEAIADADILLVSVRRRPLPPNQMQLIRDFVALAKPVVGIRTASHAFSLRQGEPPAGFVQWPEWDAQVFGGHYTNHHGVGPKAMIRVEEAEGFLDGTSFHTAASASKSASGDILFESAGSLYKAAPLEPGADVLISGAITGQEAEPVAWTFIRLDAGKSFYTSLGHVDDFDEPAFRQLLVNAVRWAADLSPRTADDLAAHRAALAAGQGRQRK